MTIKIPKIPDLIVIVTCGKNKIKTDIPVPLDQLYVGKLTKEKFEVAKLLTSDDKIYVISGVLGLVELDTESAWYNSFNRLPKRTTVEKQIAKYDLSPNDLILFIGQQKIYDFLSSYFYNFKNLITGAKGIGDFTHKLAKFKKSYMTSPEFREEFNTWLFEDVPIKERQKPKPLEHFFRHFLVMTLNDFLKNYPVEVEIQEFIDKNRPLIEALEFIEDVNSFISTNNPVKEIYFAVWYEKAEKTFPLSSTTYIGPFPDLVIRSDVQIDRVVFQVAGFPDIFSFTVPTMALTVNFGLQRIEKTDVRQFVFVFNVEKNIRVSLVLDV